MADISASMVKDLRDKTGAGMADCKKALVDADGDMNLAIDILRKKGAASAAKRADKSANEGMIVVNTSEDGKVAAILEINCETDFVARNQEFIDYVNTVAGAFLNNDVNNAEDLYKLSHNGSSLINMHNDILAKFSERIEARRLARWKSEGFISGYIHAGNKLGVMIDISASSLNDEAQALVRDIAMQIAAMNPQFVDRSQVDTTTLEKEIEIYKQQAIEQGKKEEIAEKIAQGRLEKFFTENCLIEQAFVKDGSLNVSDVLKKISEITGTDVKVNRFLRFALGEL
ncbi:MAG: elongation factor Ts [Candidatus Kapabacteria bacterium]|nr:elongation factor Ts [Ignavibacteriota bacterium]MCW5883950.1 elongation factor Ts [Candidatus Kapabacteria bacterium]